MSVRQDVVIVPKDKVSIEIGLEIYNELTQQWETVYTPMGVFYVDTTEEKGLKKSIKAYDGMYKMQNGYFPTAQHTTTYAIANDIATANGYKVKGISNVDINNEQLEGKTCIEMLSLVASAMGGHVRISRDGSIIEFIEPTNYGVVFTESDYTTPTLDDTTSYNITKLRVNYADQVTDDEGNVTDEGYYEVGNGLDANTLALSNPLLKGKTSQAQIILNKVKRLNGYKRFDTTMLLGDFRLEPMDIITYIKGEKEYIVPILYMKMKLSYQGISVETQSPTLAETKSEFKFKGTLTKKVENLYTDIIQVKQLTANKVSTDELEATVATIESLYAKKAEIGDLVAGSIIVEDLKAQVAQLGEAIIGKADIADLDAVRATIQSLQAQVAEIDTVISDSIISQIIQTGSISSDLLNIKDGFIKDAMIGSLSASKFDSGTINTNNVLITSDNGNMTLQGNLLQFKDSNGKLRIQIGQDATGNYTFTLYDSTGTGVLINQDGIQSSNAIKDGLIVDSKVASNANITGSKLNISSLYDSMNADGSKTLKASKVMLDDKKQTLEVSFKEMTTKQDELEDTMSTVITDISVAQGEIIQLIQDTTITTSNGTTKLKDAYTKLEQTVSGINSTVANQQTTINEHSGQITSVNNEMTSMKQTVDGFSTTVTELETNLTERIDTEVDNLVNGSQQILELVNQIAADDNISEADRANFELTINQITIEYNAISREVEKYDVDYFGSFIDDLTTKYSAINTLYNVIKNGATTGAIDLRNAIITYYDSYHNLLYTISAYTKDQMTYFSTRIEQTSKDVTTTISRLEVVEGVSTQINNHMRFSDDWLELYSTMDGANSAFKTRLSNERLSFYEGDTVVAYISNRKLNIENAQILRDLQIGNMILRPSVNGGVVMQYVEE
ncbi:hypothetical protein [Turicibacter sanguinis]|uniref:hypothetical protein n=1 Tax=Turicibacter sanguinis TaxID=154288 RepID=UPI00232D7159|nr:hypothetical protein [Turicibacter sanguinis]MDB8574984.1 hypothetical protein [Turicibacter sanguinis]MDB8578133.1 hypothetical protein [Turicibacter sanguinis]MDB8583609.1 hypothetical protein [Turicibacter sanguinis]MDB8586639.1 hypothetical protein [Turicibacter sanguinis]MDB8597257.1 hypothetical protein [Turicibacter sanguinis]